MSAVLIVVPGGCEIQHIVSKPNPPERSSTYIGYMAAGGGCTNSAQESVLTKNELYVDHKPGKARLFRISR